MLCGDYYFRWYWYRYRNQLMKYGMLHKSYLQEHRKAKYQNIVVTKENLSSI